MMSYGEDYEAHLNRTAKPRIEGQIRRTSVDNQFMTLPSKINENSATANAANRVIEKHEK